MNLFFGNGITSELDPRRIQWHKIHDNLTTVRKGEKAITKPTINQLTKEIGQETISLEGLDCIFFEGSYTLGDFPPMDFLHYTDLGIYLEASLENIFSWKWAREMKKSSQRTPESFYKHMMEIMNDFGFHVYPTRKNANYIIQIDFLHRYQVTDGEGVKNIPEPDFTIFRLKSLSY